MSHTCEFFASVTMLALAAAEIVGGERGKTKASNPQPALDRVDIDLYGDRLPKGAVARLGSARLWFPTTVCLAFSPDGKTLACSGRLGSLHLVEVRTGKQFRQFDNIRSREHSPFWSRLAFSPNGKMLAAAGSDMMVRLWDTATWKELYRLELPETTNAITFSPDSRYLAAGGRERNSLGGQMRLWDTVLRKEIKQWNLHRPPFDLAFTTDGKFLVSAEYVRNGVMTIRSWEVQTGKERVWPSLRTGTNYEGKLAPNGKWYASRTGDGGGTIGLYATTSGTQGPRSIDRPNSSPPIDFVKG